MSLLDVGAGASRSPARELSVNWPTIWALAQIRLRRELGDPVYDAWIAPLSLASHEGGDIKLGAVKPFVRNWVANHYAGRIEKALIAEGSIPESVSIIIVATPAPVIPVETVRAVSSPAPSASVSASAETTETGLWDRLLHPQQTFHSFVPGPNSFSRGAVQSFAEGGQEDIPLLYMHGGFGLGKTHLLNAAALVFRQRGKRVLFLRAEDFMRHFLGALYRKETLAFKEQLRAADVMIFDDLQHICRSSATANEFLYTVNAFADLRRRVVIAADRAPAALEGLEANVKSRLAGGLCIELNPPDRDARLAILKARSAEYSRSKPEVVIPEASLECIADLDGSSPREILGIFVKLATYADLTKKPVTLEVTADAIEHRTSNGGTKTTIEDIQRKTAEFYRLDVAEFQTEKRARRVARPRQVAMYLARKLTSRSLPEIGRRFGGRDHTTVLHACRRIEALMEEDNLFKQEVEFLSQMLSKKGGL